MAEVIDLSSIPDSVVLPMASAHPSGLDWNHKARLSTAQLALLGVFKALNRFRKEHVLRDLLPGDSIPAYKIKWLYEEQQLNAAKGIDPGALTDGRKSSLA